LLVLLVGGGEILAIVEFVIRKLVSAFCLFPADSVVSSLPSSESSAARFFLSATRANLSSSIFLRSKAGNPFDDAGRSEDVATVEAEAGVCEVKFKALSSGPAVFGRELYPEAV
jgi:hypothetical protein